MEENFFDSKAKMASGTYSQKAKKFCQQMLKVVHNDFWITNFFLVIGQNGLLDLD